jgi:hypothetical protein
MEMGEKKQSHVAYVILGKTNTKLLFGNAASKIIANLITIVQNYYANG